MGTLPRCTLPLGNGYTSKVYTTSLTYSVGNKENSKPFQPNRYTPLMTMVRVYTSGPTIKQMCGLITYLKHVFVAYNSDMDPMDDPFHPLTPDEWSQQTSTIMRTYFIQHLPNPNGPEPVPNGPLPSSGPTRYSPAAIEMMGFKKCIKKEIATYPSLKDEMYFDGFKKSILIFAKTHKCNEVLDLNNTPGSSPEEQRLLGGKTNLHVQCL